MFFILSVTSQIKVGVWNRIVAKMIDLLIVFFLAWLPYPVGPLSGFLYSLLCDGINQGPFRGQSIGKKVMKLQVINTMQKKPAQWKDSLLRNLPVGVATFFGIIPIWGWLILLLVGVPLMVMEVYLMITVESGHRLGDVMGDTEVVEAKP